MAEGGKNKTGKKRLAALERQRQALELRKMGLGYQKIADQLDYTGPGAAYKAVMAGLKTTLREPADELRTLEVERLDRLTLAYWKRAVEGDQEATDRVLKLMDRRAKLLGLYAAVKTEVSGKLALTLEQALTADRELEEWQRAHGACDDRASPPPT